MKQILIIPCLLIFVCVISCKKDEEGTHCNCKISACDGGAITYNSDGKLATFHMGQFDKSYSYTDNRIFIEVIDNGANGKEMDTVILNSKGQIIEFYRKGIYPSVTFREKSVYEYNAKDQIVKATSSNPDNGSSGQSITYYGWENDNNTYSYSSSNSSPVSDTFKYDYFSDLPEKSTQYISQLYLFGTTLWKNKNLLKSINVGNSMLSHFYDYDECENVIREKVVNSSSVHDTTTMHYEYLCN